MRAAVSAVTLVSLFGCASLLGLEEASLDDPDRRGTGGAGRSGVAGASASGGLSASGPGGVGGLGGLGGVGGLGGLGGLGGVGGLSGSDGLGGRGGAGSGGTGAAGNAGADACTQTSPSSCVDNVTSRRCGDDGVYETRPCSELCEAVGFGGGPCLAGACVCDGELDPQCSDGVEAYCACAAQRDQSCDGQTRFDGYVRCYSGDADIDPLLRCYAEEVVDNQIDCDVAEDACGT